MSSTRDAVPRVGLDVHLPAAVLEGEIVDVRGAEVRLERRVDFVQGDVLSLDLFAVDLHVQLRLGDAERREHAEQARLFAGLVGEILHGSLQRPQARAAQVLDLQLEAARAPQALDGRGPEDGDLSLREGRELLPQFRHDRRSAQFGFSRPLFKRRQDDEHAAHVGDVRAEDGGVAGQIDGMRDAFRLADDLAELADQLVAAVQARPVRKLGVDDQVALVLFRNEPDRRGPEAEEGEEHQAAVNRQADDARPQQHRDGGPVALDRHVENPVEAVEELAQQQVDRLAREPAGHGADGEHQPAGATAGRPNRDPRPHGSRFPPDSRRIR